MRKTVFALFLLTAIPSFAESTFSYMNIRNVPAVDVRKAGAISGDGLDDSAAINKAIASATVSGGAVLIPAGSWHVDGSGGQGSGIALSSNVRLIIDPAATVTMLPSSSGGNNIIKVANCRNVEIIGGNLIGDAGSHVGGVASGSGCFGIGIYNSDRVVVRDVSVASTSSDGVYVGYDPSTGTGTSTSILIENCSISLCGRNGIGVTSADGIVIQNSKLENNGLVSPRAQIDIEPDAPMSVKNCRISSCVISSGTYGVSVTAQSSGSSISDLIISESVISSAQIGISINDDPVFGRSINGAIVTLSAISDCASYGVYLDNNDTLVKPTSIKDNSIYNCGSGVFCKTSTKTTIDGNVISGNQISGAYLLSCNNVNIFSNRFINNGTASSSYQEVAVDGTSERTAISRNFFQTTTGACGYAIRENTGALYITVTDNSFYNASLYSKSAISLLGTDGYVGQNRGYTTSYERGGNYSPGELIPHNLVGTPTVVLLTPYSVGGSSVATDSWVSDVTSTTFKINFTLGAAAYHYWSARIYP